jgi:hypothetical protein
LAIAFAGLGYAFESGAALVRPRAFA